MATEIELRRDGGVQRESSVGLGRQGLQPKGEVHWNLLAPELMQAAIRRGEAQADRAGDVTN